MAAVQIPFYDFVFIFKKTSKYEIIRRWAKKKHTHKTKFPEILRVNDYNYPDWTEYQTYGRYQNDLDLTGCRLMNWLTLSTKDRSAFFLESTRRNQGCNLSKLETIMNVKIYMSFIRWSLTFYAFCDILVICRYITKTVLSISLNVEVFT